MNVFTPRYSQQEILKYRGGRLGIAAVPGAGKTHILSALAAKIIHEGWITGDQEVLIVTLVNSAVDNFESRIKRFFADRPLQALYKYRVRTLHGLAHDIVREKPARVGLEERFSIIDEREAGYIRRDAVNAWLASHSLDDYLDPGLDNSKRDWVRRDQLPDMVDSLALAFIRSSKDRLLTPEMLRLKLDQSPTPLPLAELGWSIYADYQRALAYRGAVDFDDLIRLALTLLETDDEYLQRLRYRYPYILEDEAQDSSLSQQRILSLLSSGFLPERSDSEVEGSVIDDALRLRSSSALRSAQTSAQRGVGGNWVRVGDPNQAIFETFTTADPELLREFIRNNPHADMPESGRSQPSIIALANHLIDWVMMSHPDEHAQNALSMPYIVPVPEDDPQRNPPDNREAVKFVSKRYTPEEELKAVVKSVKGVLDSVWDFPDYEKPTIAILVPRNHRGIEVIDALKRRGVETIELISSTSSTRAAAGSLNYLLSYLADPQSARKLAKAYEVWRRDWRNAPAGRIVEKQTPVEEDGGELETGPARMLREELETDTTISKEADAEIQKLRSVTLSTVTRLLRKMENVEDFVAPHEVDRWLAATAESEPEHVIQELQEFRVNVQRWLSAVMLPIDQLVLTLAQDVFTSAPDLALAHKLALVLGQAADDHPDWRLPELTSELAVIAKNERRFIGFSADDSGFDPEQYRGKVVVTTMHKAKGLEWDRVYMMSINNYDFPSNMPNDRFISEKWFIRGGLNLEAEALAQLTALESTGEYDFYEEGAATARSRLNYVKERLRLFYVGITRAKRELIVTWNSGRQGDATPSLPLAELMGWWEGFTE